MKTVHPDGGKAHSPPVWIDLLRPGTEEIAGVETALAVDLPSEDDIRRIEPSSRLYREGGALFMAARLAVRVASDLPDTVSVGFVLKDRTLVTIRYDEARAFDLFAEERRREAEGPGSGAAALIGLLEAIVDRTSEGLEAAARVADDLPMRLKAGDAQRRSLAELESTLSEIHLLHRKVAKLRESLVSLGRMTGFLLTQPEVTGAQVRTRAKGIARDIATLSDHASFVAQNIQFALDASLGLINIEQNAIVKFFSIVAVVLLPPTLIAGIYGMNFEVMPELSWPLGYPAALVLMAASAILPYLWCRRRGWL